MVQKACILQVVPFTWRPGSPSLQGQDIQHPKTLLTHAEPGAHLAPSDQLLLLQAATKRGRLHAVVGLPVGRGKAAQVEVPGRGQQRAVALPQSSILSDRQLTKQRCKTVRNEAASAGASC